MIEGLNADLYAEICADTTIQTLMGVSAAADVRCYYEFADRDSSFPYLVHNQFLHSDPLCWGVQVGQWRIDIWDQHDDASRVVAFRQRLVYLYQRRLLPDGDDYSACRLEVAGETPIAENSDRVWRMTLVFSVRVTASGDIAAVTAREGVT